MKTYIIEIKDNEYTLTINNNMITVSYYNPCTDDDELIISKEYTNINAGLIYTSSYIYDMYCDTNDNDYNVLADKIAVIAEALKK
jgi:hypothetical protein